MDDPERKTSMRSHDALPSSVASGYIVSHSESPYGKLRIICTLLIVSRLCPGGYLSRTVVMTDIENVNPL